MRRVFLDTSFLKARADTRDELHTRAKKVEAQLGNYFAVTTQMVLTEFLNFLAGKSKHLRRMALRILDMLHSHPNVRIFRKPARSSTRQSSCTGREWTKPTA